MSDGKVRVFKVTRDCLGQFCIFKSPEAVADAELMDSEVGDILRIEVIEMTEDEYDNLPEFEGW